MKCPHCNQDHPDDFQFCPVTGKKLEQLKACSNPDCPNHDKHVLPFDACFCPACGYQIINDDQQKDQMRGNSKTGNNHISLGCRSWDIYIKRETDSMYDDWEINCYIDNRHIDKYHPKLFYCYLEKSGDKSPFTYGGGVNLLVECVHKKQKKRILAKTQMKIPKGFKGDIFISIDSMKNIQVELQS